MPRGPIRRQQAIAPFGVGGLMVVKGGISLVAAGLDVWHTRESEDSRDLDPDEFVINEWRLERLLRVDHFRLPPDYRRPRRGEDTPNTYLTIPFLRFPQWNVCPWCGYLKKLPLTAKARDQCDRCRAEGKTWYLSQVRFIAMCEAGHLQDFPWREWVHYSSNPSCEGTLSLVSTGGASLAAQVIKCDCGAERSLSSITNASPDGTTFLSRNLQKGNKVFLCQGKVPWLGTEKGRDCDCHLRGSLRGASNVWFSQIRGAIYLPQRSETAPAELVQLLREPPLSTLIKLLSDSGVEVKSDVLRSQQRVLLRPFTDGQIKASIALIHPDDSDARDSELDIQEPPGIAFRRLEFNVLRVPQQEEILQSESIAPSEYGREVENFREILVQNQRAPLSRAVCVRV